jgi:hypothetical protein
VRNALALVPASSLPPARQALVVLNNRITDAEKRLRTLQGGKAALAAELGRAAGAKAELQELVAFDAVRLVDRLRDGGQWLLSSFGTARARELSASLSESRIQAAVGETALASVTEEIAVLEREVVSLKAQKQDSILAALSESAAGFREDLASLMDDLRQVLTILSGLDELTARTNGEWAPAKRLTVVLPAVGGTHEQVVVCPHAAIEKAKSIWAGFASDLDLDALSNVETLTFPHVLGTEDSGKVLYHEMSSTERHHVDVAHAQGVN